MLLIGCKKSIIIIMEMPMTEETTEQVINQPVEIEKPKQRKRIMTPEKEEQLKRARDARSKRREEALASAMNVANDTDTEEEIVIEPKKKNKVRYVITRPIDTNQERETQKTSLWNYLVPLSILLGGIGYLLHLAKRQENEKKPITQPNSDQIVLQPL